jgi:hypothetical protein
MGGSGGPGVGMGDGRPGISEARESVNAEVDNNSENAVLVDMTLASPDCDWPAIPAITFPRDCGSSCSSWSGREGGESIDLVPR